MKMRFFHTRHRFLAQGHNRAITTGWVIEQIASVPAPTGRLHKAPTFSLKVTPLRFLQKSGWVHEHNVKAPGPLVEIRGFLARTRNRWIQSPNSKGLKP